MADLIHAHHEDNPSIPASRHDELMRAIHKLEMDVAHATHQIGELREDANHFGDWMRQDVQRSQWYYDNREELRQLVESAKWVKTFWRAVAWLIGAVAGAVMVAQQVEIWVREHIQ